MGRLRAAATAALLAVPVVTGAAAAQPGTPTPTESPAEEIFVPEPVPGEEQCTITDPRLVEISGLVAVPDGYFVVNDGTFLNERRGAFLLNQDCQVVEQFFYPSQELDPEALALDRDANVLWIGDIGDNAAGATGEGEPRPTVALWRVDLNGDRSPVIHRFAYDDGTPRDAEALLLDADGTPLIITKAPPVGTALIFRPDGEPRPQNPPEEAVPLTQVGEFSPPDTGTENRLGTVGREVITDAANRPDGNAVVLRTYADAFEFPVTDGDVVGALTDGVPVVTPMPDEPQGESISYGPDGERFLTVSEVPEDETDFAPVILGYQPAEPPPPPTSPPPEPAANTSGGASSLFGSVRDILNLVAAVGVVGVLLVAAGIVGIVRARRRARGAGGRTSGSPASAKPATGRVRVMGEEDPPAPVAAAAGAGAVYASRSAGPPEDHRDGRGYDERGYDERGYDERGHDGFADLRYGDDDYRDHGYPDQGYPDQEYGNQGYGDPRFDDRGYGHPEYQEPENPEYQDYQDHRSYRRGYDGQGYDGQGYDGYDAPGGHPPDGAGRRGYGNYSADADYPYEFRDPGRW